MSDSNTLRKYLFDTMKDLRENKISVAAANAVAANGQVIINSVKLELDARKMAGVKHLPAFISQKSEPAEALTEKEREVAGKELLELISSPEAYPQVGVTRHYMKGSEPVDD